MINQVCTKNVFSFIESVQNVTILDKHWTVSACGLRRQGPAEDNQEEFWSWSDTRTSGRRRHASGLYPVEAEEDEDEQNGF